MVEPFFPEHTQIIARNMDAIELFCTLLLYQKFKYEWLHASALDVDYIRYKGERKNGYEVFQEFLPTFYLKPTFT